MSEPLSPPPPSEATRPVNATPTAPFTGMPTPVAGGCGKPIWIGCGALLLVLAIGGIFMVTRAKDLLAWSFDLLTPAVLQNAAADVTDDDRARLKTAIEAAKQRLKTGPIDAVALQAVQGQLQKASQSGKGGLDRAQFLALVETLEALGGVSREPPASAPPTSVPPESPPPPVADAEKRAA